MSTYHDILEWLGIVAILVYLSFSAIIFIGLRDNIISGRGFELSEKIYKCAEVTIK